MKPRKGDCLIMMNGKVIGRMRYCHVPTEILKLSEYATYVGGFTKRPRRLKRWWVRLRAWYYRVWWMRGYLDAVEVFGERSVTARWFRRQMYKSRQ